MPKRAIYDPASM